MQNKEFKLVLVESKLSHNQCIDCIFDGYNTCYELEELNCRGMAPDKSKKYHWELKEIKSETT